MKMILADTNVWIKHFRESDAELISQLDIGFVACHPFVSGNFDPSPCPTLITRC